MTANYFYCLRNNQQYSHSNSLIVVLSRKITEIADLNRILIRMCLFVTKLEKILYETRSKMAIFLHTTCWTTR
jgi:hypothetical protein